MSSLSRTGKRAFMVGISLAYRALRRKTESTVILTYHSVREDELVLFEQQMVWLEKHARGVFTEDATNGSDDRRRVAVTFDDAFQSVFDHVLPILARHDIPATIFVPTGYIGSEPGWVMKPGKPTGPVASAETLARVDPRLVRIGSHSATHPRLASLEQKQLHWELSTSKSTLEALTGGPVRLLALPYGSYAPAVVAAAGRTGYERVFANVPVNGGEASPAALVGRIDISPRDWPIEYRLKMQGAYEWMALAVPTKQALRRLLGARRI